MAPPHPGALDRLAPITKWLFCMLSVLQRCLMSMAGLAMHLYFLAFSFETAEEEEETLPERYAAG
jgi:hypothetical protein